MRGKILSETEKLSLRKILFKVGKKYKYTSLKIDMIRNFIGS